MLARLHGLHVGQDSKTYASTAVLMSCGASWNHVTGTEGGREAGVNAERLESSESQSASRIPGDHPRLVFCGLWMRLPGEGYLNLRHGLQDEWNSVEAVTQQPFYVLGPFLPPTWLGRAAHIEGLSQGSQLKEQRFKVHPRAHSICNATCQAAAIGRK